MNSRQIRTFMVSMVGAFALLLVATFVLDFGRVSSQDSSPFGLGNWTQINVSGLNDGTRVYSVRRSGSLVLVGTQNQGLFRSADSGATWQPVAQYATSYVRDLWLSGSNGQSTHSIVMTMWENIGWSSATLTYSRLTDAIGAEKPVTATLSDTRRARRTW